MVMPGYSFMCRNSEKTLVMIFNIGWEASCAFMCLKTANMGKGALASSLEYLDVNICHSLFASESVPNLLFTEIATIHVADAFSFYHHARIYNFQV